jgi:hypothetical protein
LETLFQYSGLDRMGSRPEFEARFVDLYRETPVR